MKFISSNEHSTNDRCFRRSNVGFFFSFLFSILSLAMLLLRFFVFSSLSLFLSLALLSNVSLTQHTTHCRMAYDWFLQQTESHRWKVYRCETNCLDWLTNNRERGRGRDEVAVAKTRRHASREKVEAERRRKLRLSTNTSHQLTSIFRYQNSVKTFVNSLHYIPCKENKRRYGRWAKSIAVTYCCLREWTK